MDRVVGRDAIRGDQQQLLITDRIDVANLALGNRLEVGEGGGVRHLREATSGSG
jgi:hypothetical protein